MKLFNFVLCIFCIVLVVADPGHKGIPGFEKSTYKISPRDVTLNDRLSCSGGLPDGEQPADRANTTAQVDELINLMIANGFDAYIIPSADAHQSEYTASADARRAYISGFTGSAGTAVVLADGQRALWTDGRYFLQGDEQLDCTWLMMRSGEDGVPSLSEWIIEELNAGQVVGADARLLGATSWLSLESGLSDASLSLVVEDINDGNNIVDLIWNDDGRPSYSLDPIFIHEVEFAGLDWQTKIENLRADMEEQGADVTVLTALDEVAWTLNLRGSDIAYNPVFRSYIIIDITSGETNVAFFVPDMDVKIGDEVRDQLNIDNCVTGSPCVSLMDYDTIGSYLATVSENAQLVWIPSAFSTSEGVSYYIYNTVPEEKRHSYRSSVLLMKAAKNPTEQNGMRNAHIKDAVALIDFLAYMDENIGQLGNTMTEMEAQDLLDTYRAQQENFMGNSFGTISAFGPNGAIIHYEATPETDTSITTSGLYLLDSGGQYKDGTTDVTRTMHYGVPSAYEIECYTKVFQGQLDFATITFPEETSKTYIDILARKPLYNVGLDYRHGTSHGVGMFLNVHEGSDNDFELGFHGSDEPGYYEDGFFGIRLENVVAVVEAQTKYNFTTTSYQFETLTLVPYEPVLIDETLLTSEQCAYFNAYNEKIRDVILPMFEANGNTRTSNWITTRTEPLGC